LRLTDLRAIGDALPLMDAGWLLAEGPEHTTHVGGLFLFELPDDAAGDPSAWIDEVIASALHHPQMRTPFDLRLRNPGGVLGTYSWEHDDDIDLLWHVRHLAIPRPGRIRELLSLVSRLHTPMLDRHRPMWEAHLIEGLEDGRVALYWRASHALVDGSAAIRQLVAGFSNDPDARDMVPPWALDPDRPPLESKLTRGQRTRPSPTALLGAGVASAAANLRLTRRIGEQVLRGVTRTSSVPYPAPRTIFNQRTSAARRLVAQSYELERFTGCATAAGSTVNDIVLTVCGGALRRYLDRRGELPDESLTALVPIAVRPADGPADGNALSAALTTLATDRSDPLDRLTAVKHAMDSTKAWMREATREELASYGVALFLPVLVGQLTGTTGGIPPLFNVTISNVPGPVEPQYWNGARLDGLYPLPLVFDGYALNITQASYAGSFEFGIAADRKAVPQVQRIIDDIEDELADLEAALGR
jgi:WS/DGAT/MGAT family acyltransferase